MNDVLDRLNDWTTLGLVWVGTAIMVTFVLLYATRKWHKYQFSRALMWVSVAFALYLYATWSKVLVAGLRSYDWPSWIDIQTPIINAVVLVAMANLLYALCREILAGDRDTAEHEVIGNVFTLISGEDYSRNPEAVQRLGGEQGVKDAVENLYDRVIHDPLCGPYFMQANLDRVRRKQVQMLLTLLGLGDYEGPSLGEVHRPHRVTDEAFERLMRLVADTLSETPMDTGLQYELVESLRQFKPDIVTGG